MSLTHALLTALIERPGSGSELMDRFNRSIGFFWQATHQQIYRELGRLEREGLIESTPVGGARGGKKSYSVLPAGHDALRAWVETETAPPPVRDELMVKLRAEAVVGPTGLAEELVRLLARHEAQRALYLAIETRDFADREMTRNDRLRHLVLRAGLEHETRRIAFCRDAIALLRDPA
ncbi:PadR family transcriptional regulator [Pseudooceanicola aestuarii]|uniref:PadR family transcriptional regulator n=1 Tax=Pseudooceanicola aestuarii TaxID=2697319 RepID=UPI0013D0C09A|nr:PadR family transcriptional regulator [Pseudooceanicola aestuarii]